MRVMDRTHRYKGIAPERSGTLGGWTERTTMTDEDHTTTFEIEQPDNSEPADIWVDDMFTNSYNDQRAYLDGETYETKEIIKFDWETTHHDFDGQSKRWVVDADSLPELRERLEAEGYVTDFEPERPDTRRRQTGLFEAHSFIEEGDHVYVEYEQKNGNGSSQYDGEVVAVDYNSGYEDKPLVAFRRSCDDHYMYVQFDNSDKVCLYTGGSHAPYVGAVETITVYHEDARERPEIEFEDEDDGDDGDDDGSRESLAEMRQRIEQEEA